MKLVARAGKSPEPQPLEAVVCLQVREAHFNTLPFVSRLGKRLCLHLPSCDIAGVLMDIARDLARIGRGAALRSYWAHVAVPRGAVQQRASVVHGAAGLKQFPIWADVGAHAEAARSVARPRREKRSLRETSIGRTQAA